MKTKFKAGDRVRILSCGEWETTIEYTSTEAGLTMYWSRDRFGELSWCEADEMELIERRSIIPTAFTLLIIAALICFLLFVIYKTTQEKPTYRDYAPTEGSIRGLI